MEHTTHAAAAVAMTAMGGCVLAAVSPAASVVLWAAPTTHQAAYAALATGLSWSLINTPQELAAAAIGMTAGLLGMSIAAPAAAPAGFVIAAMLGAGVGVGLTRYAGQAKLFLGSVLGFLLIGVGLIVAAGLVLQYANRTAFSAYRPNVCVTVPTRN